MALRSDQKALIFIGAVAVLGAGVRVVRASGSGSAERLQPALERQQRAADSAARAGRAAKGQEQTRSKRPSTKPRRDSTTRAPIDPVRSRALSGPLDHRGYIRGKLDLDVATMAQIDSLPGVSTGMARKIVVDRMQRGPFVTRDGLRRVSGAGPAFVAKIDTLITFSGTIRQPTVGDTVLPRKRR